MMHRKHVWLLLLGLVFVVGMSAAIAATWLIDGGKLLEVMSGTAMVDEAFLASASVHRVPLASPGERHQQGPGSRP